MGKQYLLIAIILLVLSGCTPRNKPVTSTRQPTNYEIMSEVDVELDDSVHQFFDDDDNDFYSTTDFMAEEQEVIGLNEFYDLDPKQSYAVLENEETPEELEKEVFEEHKTAIDAEQVDEYIDLENAFTEVAINIDLPAEQEIILENTQEPIT